MAPHKFVFVFFLLPFLATRETCWGTISENFKEFIQSRYGQNVASLIAREDLGTVGSYGGGEHTAGDKTAYLFPMSFLPALK